MPTTVRDVVSAPGLHLDLLVPGDLDRQVRWVHVTELADPSPYLAGDEFVLTAGVWQGRGTSARDFVRAMRDRRIAGIGWGRLAPDEPVPAEMVRACTEAGVPLAAVPVGTPFIAVTTWFVDRLTAEREADLRSTLDLARALLATADDETPGVDSLRQVCRILSRAIGREVYVADAGGTVQATSAGSLAVRRPAWKDDADAPTGPRRSERWSLHPIVAGGRVRAVLGVADDPGDRPEDPPGDLLRSRVETAVPVVGLVLARRRAVLETERRLAGEALSLVLSHQFEPARARLSSYGIDTDGPLVAVVCRVGGRDQALAAAEEWLGRRPHASVVTLRGDELSAVVTPGDEQALGLAQDLARAVRARAAGVGQTGTGVRHLRRSLVQARQACTLADTTGKGSVVSHHQMGSHLLLLALLEPDVVDAFRAATLGPVEAYDAAHGTDLVATLATFLEQRGRWQQSAAALDIHVNTLRQRLARVETLTERSLERTADRVDLWLALQVDRRSPAEAREGEPRISPEDAGTREPAGPPRPPAATAPGHPPPPAR